MSDKVIFEARPSDPGYLVEQFNPPIGIIVGDGDYDKYGSWTIKHYIPSPTHTAWDEKQAIQYAHSLLQQGYRVRVRKTGIPDA